MKQINMNTFARQVAMAEGGKQNLSIAQIKEVIRHTLGILHDDYSAVQALDAMERVGEKYIR